MNVSGLSLILLLLSLRHILANNQKPKTILLYTPMGSLNNWHLSTNLGTPEYFSQHRCPATNCIITSNRTFLPSCSDYDVIVMNSWNIPALRDFPAPQTRHEDQIYEMNFRESPIRTTTAYGQFSSLFNWTMSYRLDADIPLAYGEFFDKATKANSSPFWRPVWRNPDYQSNASQPEVKKMVESKSKMVAWFVSNCKSKSNREQIVTKMQEYIPVDIYGKCGTLSCDKKEKSGCREMVEKDYKFYLSFENSLCKDYVTEKVFDMMKYYVIPVVYGGADYTRFLPPGSYVNVQDFESVAHLVDYLYYLANDTEEYMKYFWWKDYYTIGTHKFCGICEKITKVGDSPLFTQHYIDLHKWFNDGACYEPNSIPIVKEVLSELK